MIRLSNICYFFNNFYILFCQYQSVTDQVIVFLVKILLQYLI